MKVNRFAVVAVLVGVPLCAIAPAPHAALIAYEGFQYAPPGAGLNTYAPGGIGWSNAWSGTPIVTAAGLTYDPALDPFRHLEVRGTAIDCQTGVNVRTLAIGSPLGNADGTVWFSLIAQQTSATVVNTWAGVTLPCTGPNSALFFGKPYGKSHWGLDAGSLASHRESSTLSTQQAFLVMRVDFRAGLDDAYLWVNPPLGSEPATATADIQAPLYGDFQGITQVSLASNTATLFDELRIGNSYGDVAPSYLLWAGNRHSRRGSAAIARDGLDQLQVSNIGSSGLDGFDIDTGELTYGGLSFDFASGASAFGPGYRLEVSGTGDVGDSLGVLLGKAALFDIGGGVGQLDFTIRPEIATSFEVRVYQGELLVHTEAGHSGQGITIGPAPAPLGKDPVVLSPGDPYGGLDVTLVKKPAGTITHFSCDLTDPSEIDLGSSTVVGDRIELSAVSNGTPAVTQRTLSLRVRNATQVVLANEAYVAGALSISGLGDPVLTVADSGGTAQRPAIQVKPGATSSYGVKEKERNAGSSGVAADLEAGAPDQPGKEARFTAKGKRDGTPDQPLGEVWWANVGGTQTLNADFTALGASDAKVEVYSGGVLVSSTTVSGAGQVATVGDPATIVKAKRLSYAPFDFQLSAAVHVTPAGGTQVLGDRVRIGPSPALGALGTSMTAATEDVDELDIVMTGIDAFFVVVDPLPPTTGVPLPVAGGTLGLAIERVHPNPATRGFAVAMSLPTSESARVEVLDLQGRRVRNLAMPAAAPGRRSIDLDRDGRLPPGVYQVRVTQGGRSAAARAVVLR